MNRSKKEARYQRRKQARLEKRQEKLAKYDNFDTVITIANLIKAALKAQRGVKWKPSVQQYMSNLCYNSAKSYDALMNGRDVRKGFYEFDINERGKTRHIQSLRFSERVIHKAFTDNSLYPIFTNGLIYDNYASQKGKGTEFALRRMKQFLQEHYRKHGREGYILLVDLSDYFGSIDHDTLYKIYEREYTDQRLINLAKLFIDAYDRGLGLGSETCQLDAVRYASHIDHLFKDKLGIRAYGRYMDDTFIIHRSKQYLTELLRIIESEYGRIGITLNYKKTKICDLKHGFTWLKHKYYLTNTGRVIIRPCRKSVSRERQKLKKQFTMLADGALRLDNVRTSYASWRGCLQGKDTFRVLKQTDTIFITGVDDYEKIDRRTRRTDKTA